MAVSEGLDPSLLKPSILVIFGITGDLAKRKVLPAIYHLIKDDLLPEHMALVGTSRQAMSVDEMLKHVELCVLEQDNVCDPDAIEKLRSHMQMVKVDPTDGADYEQLKSTLDNIESSHGVGMNRLYYLSIPPQVYAPIIRQLDEHGLNKTADESTTARLLVEKPFGYDLASAQDLISETSKAFTEEQIFRIDHYLAKESAQNILAFRRFNPLFSTIWNNRHITGIEVIAAEQLTIEGRANFYDSVGAMRDLIQSHLLQLLALTTMEVPEDSTDSDAIHTAKLGILSAIHPPHPDQILEHTVRAQYNGYREEVERPDSGTETFASIELRINTPTWLDVPITVTTGKALDAKLTQITVSFDTADDNMPSNQLTFRIQPHEGIDIQLIVKTPGFEQRLQTADMDFSYQNTFEEEGHPDAYERVLIDAVRGDHTLFATSEEVLASWRILQPILDVWQRNNDGLRFYEQGSGADSIIEQL